MTQPARPSLLTASLYGLGLVGVLGTWGRSALDGTLVHLLRALHGAEEYLLPGTDGRAVLRRSFTGVYWPVDYLLDVLVVFFWEAVDGSHPATSASGIYFLGQLFPVVVVFYLSALRGTPQGLAGPLLRASAWLLLFQGCALGAVGFAWALRFTGSSPTAAQGLPPEHLRRASLLTPTAVLALLPAVLLGYGGSALAMALPPSSPSGAGLLTYDFKQLAIAAWNMYPLFVSACFAALYTTLPRLLSRSSSSSSVRRTEKGAGGGGNNNNEKRGGTQNHAHLRVVRILSVVTLLASSALHFAVLSVSLATVLFPALFDPVFAGELHPARVFLPPLAAITRGRTVGDGVRSFFLWDQVAAYPTVALVLLLELRGAAAAAGAKTPSSFSWPYAVVGAAAASLLVGPGSTCVLISWLRDELLFAD